MGRRRREKKETPSSQGSISPTSSRFSSRAGSTRTARASRNEAIEALREEYRQLKQQLDSLREQLMGMTESIAQLSGTISDLRQTIKEKNEAERRMETNMDTDTPPDEGNKKGETETKKIEQRIKITCKRTATTTLPIPAPVTSVSGTKTVKKTPPIILRQKEKWSEVSWELPEMCIRYTKAKVTGDGIQISPETSEDLRKIRRHLTTESRNTTHGQMASPQTRSRGTSPYKVSTWRQYKG